MSVFEKYMKMWDEASALVFDGKAQEANALMKEAEKFRDENFTMDDWKALMREMSTVQGKLSIKKKMESLSDDK